MDNKDLFIIANGYLITKDFEDNDPELGTILINKNFVLSAYLIKPNKIFKKIKMFKHFDKQKILLTLTSGDKYLLTDNNILEFFNILNK